MSAVDGWEDVTATPEPERKTEHTTGQTGPFAAGKVVDGYAFTPDLGSPELRYERQQKPDVSVLPRREPPKRIGDQIRPGGLWQPGGSAQKVQPQTRMPRPNVLKALLSGLVPLGLLGGGIYLVMRLYGF